MNESGNAVSLWARRHARTLAPSAVLVLLLALGGMRHDAFISAAAITGLLEEYAYVAIAAVGATLVIIAGGIDLSVGSVTVFSSVLAAHLIERQGWNPALAGCASLAAGAGAGALMGLLIAGLELPAFMVTLSGMFAIRAAAFAIEPTSLAVRSDTLTRIRGDWEVSLGGGAGVDARTALMLLALGAGWVIARRTRLGRSMHAIGGQERAARMMGVNVAATKVMTYAIAGTCSALAGLVFLTYREAADPTSAAGLELTVIAAVAIGGTKLTGGAGSVIGSLLGVLILGTIRMLIDYEGNLNSAWTSVATGGLLLGFVSVQRALSRGSP